MSRIEGVPIEWLEPEPPTSIEITSTETAADTSDERSTAMANGTTSSSTWTTATTTIGDVDKTMLVARTSGAGPKSDDVRTNEDVKCVVWKTSVEGKKPDAAMRNDVAKNNDAETKLVEEMKIDDAMSNDDAIMTEIEIETMIEITTEATTATTTEADEAVTS